MVQMVWKDKIYICGKLTEVISQIKELSLQHRFVKDILDSKFPAIDN